MGYCFMTTKKLSSSAMINSTIQHNLREVTVLNADPNRKDLNDDLVSLKNRSIADVLEEKIGYRNQHVSRKMRVDAVKALEVVMTVSKEDAATIDLQKWKEDNVQWLKDTFNVSPDGKDNVVSVVYHGDESNAHIHAVVIPMDEKGEFCVSRWVGGAKKLAELQTEYGKRMQAHGLTRGLKHSVARHNEIKRFYAELDQAISIDDHMQIHKEETLEEYRDRMIDFAKDLQAANLRNVKIKDREIVELKTALNSIMKTKSLDEAVQLQLAAKAYRKESKKWQGLERIYGNFENVQTKIEQAQQLNDAILKCPDTDLQQTILSLIQRILDLYEKEREKERKIEKTKQKERKVFGI